MNLEAHYKLLGGGGAASEAAGEEVADLAEAELGGAVARGGVLPWVAQIGRASCRERVSTVV